MPVKAKRLSLKYHFASAKNAVTATVPPNMILLFASNQYAILHPTLFNEVSAAGIDAVKFSFMSMDENEDGVCDKALPYASHYSDASRLDISESDASDAGIDSIKAMPKLRWLLAYSSSVRGSCLKKLDRFPKLNEIDLSNCAPFHQDDLKYLVKLHDLSKLELASSIISKEGVAQIAACKGLTYLNLSKNKAIDDSCLPLLLSLKNLDELQLRETSVTARGLLAFTDLKLTLIHLSTVRFSESDRKLLQKRFPKVRFEFYDEKLTTQTKQFLQPVLGH
jgi:Leucine-rich repeat (LRR) protein